MKDKEKFEANLLGSGELMKRTGTFIVGNIGKSIAIITLVVSVLLVFTDIAFLGFGAKNFTSTLAVMLIGSYLMYFSLEEAGERLGEDSEEYKGASEKYKSSLSKISADDVSALREFCREYTLEELKYRRTNLLYFHNLSYSEYEKYLKNGASGFTKDILKIFKKADKLKAIDITPKDLLSHERGTGKSELANPEAHKTARLALGLIPSTVCMTLTVSVMLTAKENLGAAEIIDGILKLSALPIIGLRGYATGYNYIKCNKTEWTETKSRLLDMFIIGRS